MLTVLVLSETREQHDEQQAEQPSYKYHKVCRAVRKNLLLRTAIAAFAALVMTKPSCGLLTEIDS